MSKNKGPDRSEPLLRPAYADPRAMPMLTICPQSGEKSRMFFLCSSLYMPKHASMGAAQAGEGAGGASRGRAVAGSGRRSCLAHDLRALPRPGGRREPSAPLLIACAASSSGGSTYRPGSIWRPAIWTNRPSPPSGAGHGRRRHRRRHCRCPQPFVALALVPGVPCIPAIRETAGVDWLKCEIEFLPVGEGTKAGDAIVVRYGDGNTSDLMLIDGGHASTGDEIVRHLRRHFGPYPVLRHVLLSHSDADHASGLRTVMREIAVVNQSVAQKIGG